MGLGGALMTKALDNAWQLHAAQMEWTGKVDTKAGFILTLDTAAIATGVALSADGLVFHGIRESWIQVLYGFALSSLIVAAALAAWAVAPALRSGKLKEEATVDFIYFGHSRHWQADDLAAVLRDGDALPVVTRQVVRMAGIAWDKHRRVWWSTWLTLVGVALMAASGMILSVI